MFDLFESSYLRNRLCVRLYEVDYCFCFRLEQMNLVIC